MRICRTLTNLLPIFAVADGSSLTTFADTAGDVDVGCGGGVTFAVVIGINFFIVVDGGVVVVASLLFDFDLIVTKLVNDVCSVGFLVDIGVDTVFEDGLDD